LRTPLFLATCFVLLFPACGLFRKSSGSGPASSASPRALEVPSAPGSVAPLTGPVWKPLSDASFIGLPQGCKLGRDAREAPMPQGAVRFTAPAEGSELVMAVDGDGNDTVEQAGILDGNGRPSASFPWTVLGNPPVALRTSTGIIAARTQESGGGLRSLVFVTPAGQLPTILEGDQLEIADALCNGSTCAVLTNFAAKSAVPGATLMIGSPSGASSAWKRVDFPAGENEWSAFSIVNIDDASILVALSGHEKIGVWRVAEGRSTEVGTMNAPFGAYDVVLGDVPVAVVAGENIDAECAKDGFAVKLVTSNGKPSEIDAHVPPEAVVVRRLAGGFIVGWLSPTRCRLRSRQTARAFLLGRDGVPRTSTMAMTEADGFAMSTHGADLDLWLVHEGKVVWAKGTCRIPEAAPTPTK
jgi:hypothetical protein